jgi:hypothetical protein
MDFIRLLALSIATLVAVLGTSGCLTQRTVTQNGHVVSQDYIVNRPIRDAIRESKD